MAKRIGFMCDLKLPWLNQTADFVCENLPEEEIKERLDKYLGFEIRSENNIRRTREILLNIWYRKTEYSSLLHPDAMLLYKKFRDDSLPVHWGLMLAAYPVFADFCRVIGKIAHFQSSLTLSQIKRRMADEWGERSTLFKSIDEMAATLRAFGVLASDSPGKYHILRYPVKQEDIGSFLVCSAMSVGTRSSYSYQDINDMDTLFPFEYQLEKESMLQDERFEINNLGGELAVSMKSI